MKIIPTILTSSRDDLEKKLDFLSGKIDWVQIDVIDGKFADNKTFPIEWLNDYHDKELFWDIHLMVKNPFGWVARCDSILAERVVGHIEFMDNQLEFIERVASEGIQPGLAIDLETPLEKINKEAFRQIEEILILTVKAGFSGQSFDERAIGKINKLVGLREELKANFKIAVDGGVNKENLSLIEEAGVDVAYMGTAFWAFPDGTEDLLQLR